MDRQRSVCAHNSPRQQESTFVPVGTTCAATGRAQSAHYEIPLRAEGLVNSPSISVWKELGFTALTHRPTRATLTQGYWESSTGACFNLCMNRLNYSFKTMYKPKPRGHRHLTWGRGRGRQEAAPAQRAAAGAWRGGGGVWLRAHRGQSAWHVDVMSDSDKKGGEEVEG